MRRIVPPPPDGHPQRSEGWRHWITPRGEPGPQGQEAFPAEAGRYHLYASLGCPWTQRCLLGRQVKGLQDLISVSYSRAYLGPEGWSFAPEEGGTFREDFFIEQLAELYRLAAPGYRGRATLPVLWDKQGQTIVSNDSGDILRLFNTAFARLGASSLDLYPEALRAEIDSLNALIGSKLNDGVYQAGFADNQAAYEEAVQGVFSTLDLLEERLSSRRWLTGARLTEADLRLFPTLVRFDAVYHGHFKCSLRRLTDYPALWAFTRDLYQWPGVATTVDLEFSKRHYYLSHTRLNPGQIVPLGPQLDFSAPHGREQFSG